jgi:hypothetical protein
MADPLSLMASIAGVATTGVAVSMSIYEMIRSLKTAPNEIKEMAKDLSILSAALRNLRRVMKDNDEVCKSRLKSDIKDALRHVRKLHSEVKRLLKRDYSGIRRVKAVFKARDAKVMLARIGGLTQAVNVMFGSVQLAATHAHTSK